MTDTKSVTAALAAVMGELGGIGKMTPEQRRKAGLGGGDERGISYAYRGIDQIASAVQPLLAKHGVVIAPYVFEFDVKDIVVNQKPWTDTTVEVEWDIYGPAGDSIKAATIGMGRDNSDKGANKAMTQAFKNLLLRLLCIGDPDDDVDGHTHERDVAPPAPSPDDIARRLGHDSYAAQASAFEHLRDATREMNAESVIAWVKAQGITKNTLTGEQVNQWNALLAQVSAAESDDREASVGFSPARSDSAAESDPAPTALDDAAVSEPMAGEGAGAQAPSPAPSRRKAAPPSATDTAKRALAHAGMTEPSEETP